MPSGNLIPSKVLDITSVLDYFKRLFEKYFLIKESNLKSKFIQKEKSLDLWHIQMENLLSHNSLKLKNLNKNK